MVRTLEAKDYRRIYTDGAADYVDTGTWTKKAIAAAKKVGKVNVLLSTRGEDGVCRRVPKPAQSTCQPPGVSAMAAGNSW